MKTKKGVSILTKPRGRPPKVTMEMKQFLQLRKKYEEEKKQFEEEKKRLDEEKKKLEEDRKREQDERKRENNKKREDQNKLEEEKKREGEKKQEETKKRGEENKREEENQRDEETNRKEQNKSYGDSRRGREDRRFGHDNHDRNRNRHREYSRERRFRYSYSPEDNCRNYRYTSCSPSRFRCTSENVATRQLHNIKEVQMLRSKIRELEHSLAESKLRELKHIELQQSMEITAPKNSNEDEISKLKNRIRHYQQNNADLKKKLDYSNTKLSKMQPGLYPPFAPSYKPPTNFSQEYNPPDYYYNNY